MRRSGRSARIGLKQGGWNCLSVGRGDEMVEIIQGDCLKSLKRLYMLTIMKFFSNVQKVVHADNRLIVNMSLIGQLKERIGSQQCQQ